MTLIIGGSAIAILLLIVRYFIFGLEKVEDDMAAEKEPL